MKNLYFNDKSTTLEEIVEELNKVLDISYDGITITNEKGKIIYANKSIEDLFGVTLDQIIGADPSDLEERKILDTNVTWQVIKLKKRVTVKQRTVGNRLVMVTGTPIFNENNKLERVINISKDISKTTNLDNKINDLQAELAWYKNELKKRNSVKEKKIFHNSLSMNKVLETIYHVSSFDTTVLILGETGVGKGFIARQLHSISPASAYPFVSINCGAIPENLLEAELFGYEKGAFTGASSTGKKGLFEVAGKGTIFLDEIGEMPLDSQVKLLHVLDHKKAMRVNGTKSYSINARIVAATNRDLNKLVQEGLFREDLYYRLNIVPLTVPPLRERKEDLVPLINSILERLNNKYNTDKHLTNGSIEALYNYHFPGNIRELENLIERLVITVPQDDIDDIKIKEVIAVPKNQKERKITTLKEAVEKIEKDTLYNALKIYKTTREAGRVLKIDQSTVVKKAQKYGINMDDFK